jgi:four helix bundle protein
MGAYRFEDLRVWQAAREQCNRVGLLIRRPEFRGDWELSSQLNAASLSVMNNISEGFLRHRDKEFLQFLRVAAASNGEVRACYYASLDRGYLGDVEATELIELSNSIGRMTRRLQAALQTKEPQPTDRPRTKD